MLQSFDLSLTTAALICGGLCIGIFFLIFVLPIALDLLGVAFDLLTIFGDVLTSGPTGWCGCLIVIAGCGLCTVSVLLIGQMLTTCGTENAVNFCRLLP